MKNAFRKALQGIMLIGFCLGLIARPTASVQAVPPPLVYLDREFKSGMDES